MSHQTENINKEIDHNNNKIVITWVKDDVLTNLIVVNISQCVSEHRIVCFTHIQCYMPIRSQ